MNRKADVNWVIVSMVIALIVLFVLIYIFYSQAKGAQTGLEGLSSCQSRGGHCEISCPAGEEKFYHYGCPDKGDKTDTSQTKVYCCIPPETK
jgi:hypothetical protein